MKKKSHAVIIGGGIIGLSSAVKLAEAGIDVTVIDKAQIGFGCSYGNAGWMTPCFAMPLPMPGMLLKSMKWLINPEGPLYIKPSPSVLLAEWLTRFMFAMNKTQAQTAIEALVALSKVSLREYEKLSLEYPEIDFQKKGLLMVGQTSDGVDAAIEEMNLVSEYQIPGRKLTAEQVKELEPAITGSISGGVYFPEEAHGEPLKIVQALAKKAKAMGVTILEDTEFLRANFSNGKIQSIQIKNAEQNSVLVAEYFVLAAGSWSEKLANDLNISVPILGGKGYALITPQLIPQPQIPIMLVEKKIAVTPRKDSLRLAGTLELVHQDFSITERRVQAIVKGSRQFLNVPEKVEIFETWRGLRPCTPDGVPMIGFTNEYSNLMLACGHQMLGLQSGLGTGILVADLITKGNSVLDRKVYDPNRF